MYTGERLSLHVSYRDFQEIKLWICVCVYERECVFVSNNKLITFNYYCESESSLECNMHTQTNTHTNTHTKTHTQTNTHTHKQTHKHTHTNTQTHTHTNTHTNAKDILFLNRGKKGFGTKVLCALERKCVFVFEWDCVFMCVFECVCVCVCVVCVFECVCVWVREMLEWDSLCGCARKRGSVSSITS